MASFKHSTKRSPKHVAPTMPEIPIPPLTERPVSSRSSEAKRKKRDTLPSSGSQPKSQRGRYSIHTESRKIDIVQIVEELSSSILQERSGAAKKLITYAKTAEKAKEVTALLPPHSSKYISEVRAHCLSVISKELW